MKRLLPALALILLPSLAPAAPGSKTPAKATPAPAADSASSDLDAAVKARIDAFFTHLQKGNVEDGYGRLFEGASMAKDQPELLTDLVDNTTKVLQKCGKVESASLLRVRSAGKTLKEVVYIVNCQKRPLRWKLYAYYGEGRWQIIDTNVDLELGSFFEPEKPSRGN